MVKPDYANSNLDSDHLYQNQALAKVSRTFALTIPQLPKELQTVVGNAYLLCRIADTIEDEAAVPPSEKRLLSERFISVLEGLENPDDFAGDLIPLLSKSASNDERDLVANINRVVRITHFCTSHQQQQLKRCIRIMSSGMSQFQTKANLDGLANQKEMDEYCYHVAGVVGELLTELFCEYCPNTAVNYKKLINLAVSFGQALQMTNILKDLWEDRKRGVCWYPRDIFNSRGVDLGNLTLDHSKPGFRDALHELCETTYSHQVNAMEYILLISEHQVGIRRHCLWALAMSILTLVRIYENPNFTNGQQVKISRMQVASVVANSQKALESNEALCQYLNQLFSKLAFANHAKEVRC